MNNISADINMENKAKELAEVVIKKAIKEVAGEIVLKDVAKEIAKEAIFEIVNRGKDRRYQNTHILMLNYNTLKEHINNDDECISIEFGNENNIKVEYMWLESIARSKARTAEMLYYVDEKLKFLEYKYKENKEYEKYEAFNMFYIEGKTNQEIQEKLKCGKNSPKRWSDNIIRELSVLLWGIDAIKMYS